MRDPRDAPDSDMDNNGKKERGGATGHKSSCVALASGDRDVDARTNDPSV